MVQKGKLTFASVKNQRVREKSSVRDQKSPEGRLAEVHDISIPMLRLASLFLQFWEGGVLLCSGLRLAACEFAFSVKAWWPCPCPNHLSAKAQVLERALLRNDQASGSHSLCHRDQGSKCKYTSTLLYYSTNGGIVRYNTRSYGRFGMCEKHWIHTGSCSIRSFRTKTLWSVVTHSHGISFQVDVTPTQKLLHMVALFYLTCVFDSEVYEIESRSSNLIVLKPGRSGMNERHEHPVV